MHSVKCNWNRIPDDCRLVQRLLDEESRGEGDLSEFLRASEALQNRQWRPLRVSYTIGGSGGPGSHSGPAGMGWHLEEVVRGKYTAYRTSFRSFPLPFLLSHCGNLCLCIPLERIFSHIKNAIDRGKNYDPFVRPYFLIHIFLHLKFLYLSWY